MGPSPGAGKGARPSLARLTFLSAAAALLVLSCARSPSVAWNGEYHGVSEGGAESRSSALAIQGAGKGSFLFALALSRENGYTRELAGRASYKGREARTSGDGYEIVLTLDEGEEPGLLMDISGPMMEAEGLAARIGLKRRTEDKKTEAAPTPAGISAEAGEFRFGYYLPEGALGDALPESLEFLFFDREGMKVREIRMFEGMSDEGRELGAFSISEEAIRISRKDSKTGKTAERLWKREEGGAVVNESGQRFFFWKANLEE